MNPCRQTILMNLLSPRALLLAVTLSVGPAGFAQTVYTVPPEVEGNPLIGASLGAGFDRATGQLLPPCPEVAGLLTNPTAKIETSAPGSQVKAALITDYSDNWKSLAADLAARYAYNGVARIGIDGSFSNWRRLTRQRQTVAITITESVSSEDLVFSGIMVSNAATYLARHGDGLVTGVTKGGVATLYIDIDSSDSKETSRIAAALQLLDKVSDSELSARAEAATQSAAKSAKITVRSSSRPALASLQAPGSLEELSHFVAAFRSQVASNSAVIGFRVANAIDFFDGEDWQDDYIAWTELGEQAMTARLGIDATRARYLALDAFVTDQKIKDERANQLRDNIVVLNRASDKLASLEKRLQTQRILFRGKLRASFTNALAAATTNVISTGSKSITISDLSTDLLRSGTLFGYDVKECSFPGGPVSKRLRLIGLDPKKVPTHSPMVGGEFQFLSVPGEGLVVAYGFKMPKMEDQNRWATEGDDPVRGRIPVVQTNGWIFSANLELSRPGVRNGMIPMAGSSAGAADIGWDEGTAPATGIRSVRLWGEPQSSGGRWDHTWANLQFDLEPVTYFLISASRTEKD